MRRAFAALACLALLAAAPAHAASSVRADVSDLWWNAAESGWGAHVTLQDEVVFLVLFVYDGARQPRFFVSSDMRPTAGGGNTFEGALLTTRGPFFPGPFDPSLVTHRAVGPVSLRFDSPAAATLTYTVDGATVTKAITRQAWRPLDLTGTYRGGIFANATALQCPLGLPTIEYPGTLVVSQSGETVTIDATFAPGFADGGTCSLVGRLVQHGSQADITGGTYACEFNNGPNPVSGTFEITGIEAGESGFNARYAGLEGAACVHTGRIGGFLQGYVEDGSPPPEED